MTSAEFDWISGVIHFPSSQKVQELPEWSIVVCGDWAPNPEHIQPIVENLSGFYGDLLPVIRQADLALVNLECVLSDRDDEPIVKDGIPLRLPARAVAGLAEVPFQVACLANNHIFDYGKAGLTETLDLLQRHYIQPIGAGLSAEEAKKVGFFQFGDTRLAIVNVAEGEEARSLNGGPGIAPLDLIPLKLQLSSLRSQVDVLIVVVHAGREHLPTPAPYIRAAYHSLVEAGADLVVGHHPHVPQGIEIYQNTPIVYSLGNFALWMDTPVRYHYLGYFLKAKFYGPQLSKLEIWPYQIQPSGLRLLAQEPLANFLSELRNLSTLITDNSRLENIWNAYADRWLISVGVQELADSIASIGGERLLLQSTLKASLSRFKGNHLLHRLARRALGRGLDWLVGKNQAEQPWSVFYRRPQLKQGASILRNRFDTLAHRELALTALARAMAGQLGQTPEWANQALSDWQVFEQE